MIIPIVYYLAVNKLITEETQGTFLNNWTIWINTI